MTSWQDFDKITLVQLPLFLFSGTFFPVTAFHGVLRWVVEATPLYRGVVLCRELTTGVDQLGVGRLGGLPGGDGRDRPARRTPAARHVAADLTVRRSHSLVEHRFCQLPRQPSGVGDRRDRAGGEHALHQQLQLCSGAGRRGMAQLDQLLLEHGARPLTVRGRLLVDGMVVAGEAEIGSQVAAAAEAGLGHQAIQRVEHAQQTLSWGASAARVESRAEPLLVVDRGPADDLDQESVLPAEVLVEGAPRHTGLLQDRVDADPRALVVGEPRGGLQEAVTRARSARVVRVAMATA